jgi:hypothetical protein
MGLLFIYFVISLKDGSKGNLFSKFSDVVIFYAVLAYCGMDKSSIHASPATCDLSKLCRVLLVHISLLQLINQKTLI